MLKLDVTQEEQLTFETQIEGVQYDQLNSHLKIIIGEIEYGIPAKVGRELITVDIPPLNKIVGLKINEGDEAEIVLEIIADGRYITPWQDIVTFVNPVIVEAKIKKANVSKNISLQTKLVVKEDSTKQTKTEDKETKLKENDQSNIEEVPDKTSELKKNDQSNIEGLLDKTIDKLKLNEGKKKKKKNITLEEFKRNLTKEDVLKFIEKKGTKKPQIQELIYEQAKSKAKKDTPVHILKEVALIFKQIIK